MNNKVDTIDGLLKVASEALRESLSASDTRKTELLREVATAFVDARNHFYTKEGEPDWLGRTYAYRTWVREAMSRASVPSEQLHTLQAAVRYHSGNILRDRLDDETLNDLGLRKSSPRERSVEKRERTSSTLNLFNGGAELQTAEEISQACALIEAALKRVNASTVEALPANDRRVARAALLSVSKRAKEIAGKA